MVCDVEEFGPELEFVFLGQREIFEGREVDVGLAGSKNVVSSQVPERVIGRNRKRGGIEPFDATLRKARIWVTDLKRPLIAALYRLRQ
jgi:hypothetical protein